MKKALIAIALASALLATGCTSGSKAADDGGGGAAAADKNQIPDTVQPIDLRSAVHDSVKDKRVAYVPLLYKGYKITQQWGNALERVVTMEGGKFEVFDSNFDTDQMIRTIDGLIQGKKADVLVLHNPDVSVLTKQIQDAKAAGIYTIVLNLMSSQTGDAFVGADTISASRDIAYRAFTDCKARNKTKVALINGPGTNGFDQLFAKGVRDAAKEKGFEVVAETKSNYQVDLASQQATTLAQKYKSELCAIILPWDVLAIPAGKSVKRAESQGTIEPGDIGIYSLDASSEGCDAVRSGDITALASYDVPGIGSAAAVVLQNLLQLGIKPGTTHTAAYVDHTVFDKATVDEVATACYTGK
jgi:ribose transport system substrate-binding protein|nr:sugar transporter substrate-binding protein [Aeromicrobium sp.]